MSAVNFNSQPVIAGQKIGVSLPFAIILWVVVFGLTLMNIYHIDNFLVSKLTNQNSSFVFVWMLHIIAVSASLLEIPLAKSIVTNYRLHGFNLNVFLQAIFTLIIASMAVIGGINSQLTDADLRDSQITSHESKLGSFETRKNSLEMRRASQRARANKIQDKGSREIAKIEANQRYYSALASLQQEQAGHELNRPTRALETGSNLHWLTISLFSLVCSFGVIFVSGFMAVYYQSLVSLPAFSLMSKANHEWQSDGSDFVTEKHKISPLNNRSSSYARIEKDQPNENRPAPDATRVNEQNSVSGRTLNPDTNEGVNSGATSPEQYVDLRRAIVAGDLPPTVRAIKSYLKSEKIGESDKTRSTITDKLLTKMKAEGVLILNPEQGKTNKVVAKYVLNPDYKAGQSATNNDKPDRMISSACPACQHQSKVSESNLKKWGGAVSCPECKTDYRLKKKAKIMPVAGAGLSIGEDGIPPTIGLGAGVVK